MFRNNNLSEKMTAVNLSIGKNKQEKVEFEEKFSTQLIECINAIKTVPKMENNIITVITLLFVCLIQAKFEHVLDGCSKDNVIYF